MKGMEAQHIIHRHGMEEGAALVPEYEEYEEYDDELYEEEVLCIDDFDPIAFCGEYAPPEGDVIPLANWPDVGVNCFDNARVTNLLPAGIRAEVAGAGCDQRGLSLGIAQRTSTERGDFQDRQPALLLSEQGEAADFKRLDHSSSREPKLKPRWDVHLSGDDDQLG